MRSEDQEYGPELRDKIVELAFERGILFLGRGPTRCASRRAGRNQRQADAAIDALEESVEIVSKA